MKKYFRIMLSLLITYNGNAQDSVSVKVNRTMKEYLSCKKTTGIIIGVVNKDKTYVFSYGETAKGNGAKPDSSTIFEIGELTYLFTSSLLVDLSINDSLKIDESAQKHLGGRVNIPSYQKVVCKPITKYDRVNEEPVRDYVNYTTLMCFPDPEYHPEKILLCDLATHTSGLPLNPSNIKKAKTVGGPYKEYSRQKFYDYLNNYILLKEEKNEFNFSNTGMAVLGEALSIYAGQPYDVLLSKKILRPLNMNNTSVELNETQKKLLAKGTNAKLKFVEPWQFNSFASAIGLKSNMSDMLLFLKANMRITKTTLNYTFDYVQSSRVIIQSGKLKGLQEGMSWIISPLNEGGQTIIWQGGLTGGYASFIGFSKTSHIGIVILSNTSNQLNDLGLKIIKEMN